VTLPKHLTLLPLLGITLLAACAGVETGTVSPCHGRFQAEGKYFAAREQADGTTVIVSTMNGPDALCAD
jgi:hypothetical protein